MSQQDRELLALAAKAAGMNHLMWTPGRAPIIPGSHRAPGEKVYWNPLTDDGDALRLAVKLHLCVKVYTDAVIAGNDHTVNGREMAHETKGDPAAATRRAIVRAAAQLATKPEQAQ